MRLVSAPRHSYAGGAAARYLLLASAGTLMAFGLVMIYSASSVTAAVKEGSSWYFLGRQLVAVVIGGAIAAALSRLDYRRLRDHAQTIWYGGLALLVAVLILGVVRGGARRWIPLGLFNLQPSELAKIACVLLVASIALDWHRGRIPTKTLLWRSLVATAAPAVLIMLQPDLGTTMTLVVAVACVLILAGIELRWIAVSFAGAVAAAVLMIAVEPYRMKRLIAFTNPFADPLGKGYQSVQALYAFGSGGLDGVGLGLSRQKFFYLPEAHTDFILAIVGEETGLIGTLLVVLGFIVLIWAGFKIATGAKDGYGRLVAGGLTGMLAFQAFLNMAAVTGIMPVTGKPLPFMSYGGSSIIVTMICLGLILSVSEYGTLAPRAVRSRPKPATSEEKRPREGAHERRGNGGARIPRAQRRRDVRRRA